MTPLELYTFSYEQAKKELVVLEEQMQAMYRKEEELEALAGSLRDKIAGIKHGLEPGTVVIGPGDHKYSVVEIVFSDDLTAKPHLWGLHLDDSGRATKARRNLGTRWRKVP